MHSYKMKLVLVLCVLGSTFAAVAFPSLYSKLDDVLDLSTRVDEDVATFWIRKHRKGVLGFGFGSSMKDADIFLVQVQNGALTFTNCRLTETFAPQL